MKITIHRGIDQIGGCITEIASNNACVLIDLGQNLPDGEGVVQDDLANRKLGIRKYIPFKYGSGRIDRQENQKIESGNI